MKEKELGCSNESSFLLSDLMRLDRAVKWENSKPNKALYVRLRFLGLLFEIRTPET